MKLKIFAATLLLALSAAGADSPLPSLRVEPKTGGSIFYVKNVATAPLTAYIIELVDYPGSSYSLWQEEVDGKPIAPGQEKKIEVGNMTVGAVPDYVKIRAAIYADGTTAGIPEKVDKLVMRRRFMLETAQDLIRRVEGSVAAKRPADAVAATLKQAADLMVVTPSMDRESQLVLNRTVGHTMFVETASYLNDHSLERTLDWLKAKEKALKESKPAL
jgi:hypothetical protein